MKVIRESRLYPLVDSQAFESKGLRNQKMGNSPTVSNVDFLPTNSYPPLDLQQITLVEDSHEIKCQRESAEKSANHIIYFSAIALLAVYPLLFCQCLVIVGRVNNNDRTDFRSSKC